VDEGYNSCRYLFICLVLIYIALIIILYYFQPFLSHSLVAIADKDQATKQLIMSEWQLSLSYLADTITALYSKARGRAEVLCLVSTFGEGIAKWLKDSPVPPDSRYIRSSTHAHAHAHAHAPSHTHTHTC
jgi:hypothetical protein